MRRTAVVGWGSAILAYASCATAARALDVPFHQSLDSTAAILAGGGVITAPIGYGPGVVGHAAVLDGGAVAFSNPAFAASAGSVSLWLRKDTADASGGILQIGVLGTPNSLGLFYVNGSDVVLEMRNAAGAVGQALVADALPAGEWTHIVATWRSLGSANDLMVFVNGAYRAYSYLPGTAQPAGALQLGYVGYYGYGSIAADELRFFDWALIGYEAAAEFTLSAERIHRQPTGKPVSTGPVRLIDDALVVHGRPFRVKGVGYAPTPIGLWPAAGLPHAAAVFARDLALLRAMNVNTIRLWAQSPDAVLLDACWNNGVDPIMVIMGFWVPLEAGVDYDDEATAAAIEADLRALVNQFKDHPALLAWGLGNENNIAYAGDLADWFVLAERLAAAAYAEEGVAYHPTIVVNAGLGQVGSTDFQADDVSLAHVDLWGHNMYVGWDAQGYFDFYAALTAKPMIATEFGIDAWDNVNGQVYEATQAAWNVQQWRQIKARTLGATVMAYADEWWKAGDPTSHDFGGYSTGAHPDGYSNEEWWGMVAVEDNGSAPDIVHPRQTYYALAAEWLDRNGDVDADDDVDLEDFAVMQQCFGRSAAGACSGLDFEPDGVIDAADLAWFFPCLDGPGKIPACPH